MKVHVIVKDVHEQPEWPSTSYPAACVHSNYLFRNANSVFGFVVMIDDFSYRKIWHEMKQYGRDICQKQLWGTKCTPLDLRRLKGGLTFSNSFKRKQCILIARCSTIRCDLARGWRPEVAGRTRTIPAPRRPDRYLSARSAGDSEHSHGERAAHWWFAWFDRGAADPGSIYVARNRAASIVIEAVAEALAVLVVSAEVLEVLVVLEEALAAVLANEKVLAVQEKRCWQYWEETCQKCLDEPSRSAYGRTIEQKTRT
ncbi:hypothetical protein T02_15051 [Trichinella nativa]|uniref:Uncharacterized protein n=1 Tax=Trichinella nativa TaxID=6335 RepID=A0A0V1KL92_9BILA|nr:hypothetical protein T02_15051 [Trichinella nativa]